jgi:hypothetical protein
VTGETRFLTGPSVPNVDIRGHTMDDLLPKLLYKIVRPKGHDSSGGGKMVIVIQRSYSQLEMELNSVFKGQPEVMVVVDRRKTDRRSQFQQVAVDRRRADRRRQVEQMIDVVISA